MQAFAGTGKTTTILEYSKIFKDESILYLAYNDSVVKDAKKKFPKNVKVLTFHSFAYASIGYKYKHKLRSNIPLMMVIKNLFLPNNNKSLLLSRLLVLAIEKFLNSELYDISDGYYYVKENLIGVCSKDAFVKYLKKIWNDMDNLDINFPVTHDFYLKKLQLSDFEHSFDTIMFDECQDANPTIKNVIMNSSNPDVKIFFIGDKYQNIYGSFRHTINLFEEKESNSKTFYLTQSFRFGDKIANYTNYLLSFLGEKNKINGNPSIDSHVDYIDTNSQYTVISRNNATLLGYAIEASKKNKRIFFLDDKKSANIQKILDIYFLSKNERKKIKNAEIKKFTSLEHLEKFAINNGLSEYDFFIQVVKRNKSNMEESIALVNKLTVDNIDDADIVLSTTHKSKGLEFNQVLMANDFYDPFDKNNNLKTNLKIEEIYIFYVATTRAIFNLKPNKTMQKIINYEKQKTL